MFFISLKCKKAQMAEFSDCLEYIEARNHLGCKRLLKSSAAITLALPSPPLNNSDIAM